MLTIMMTIGIEGVFVLEHKANGMKEAKVFC